MAGSTQWEREKNGEGLKNEDLEQVSTPGHYRSRMERTVRQQAHKVIELHQTIDSMTRMLDAHAVWEEAQWCDMKE